MLLLVTGAAGKVGRNLVGALLSEPRWRETRVRALCHNRALTETGRIEVVKGTIDDRVVDLTGLRTYLEYPYSSSGFWRPRAIGL